MNIFFFPECPWKSRYISILWVCVILLTKFFMSIISGYKKWFLVLNYLFMSFPDAPVREFPRITPSGLTIGTITNKTLHHSINTSIEGIFPQESSKDASSEKIQSKNHLSIQDEFFLLPKRQAFSFRLYFYRS